MNSWHGKDSSRTLLLILLGLICLSGLRVYWLWKTPPAYWQEHQQFLQRTDPERRMEMAQSVEQRILNQLTFVHSTDQRAGADGSNVVDTVIGSVNPDETKIVFITLEEINAWMDQRLKDWASHQGMKIPDYVSDPMVAIEGEEPRFAFKFERPDFQQVISAVTRVQIKAAASSNETNDAEETEEANEQDRGDKATVQVIKIRTGKLRIPGVKIVTDVVGGGHKEGSPGFAKVASDIKKMFDGAAFDPLIKISKQKIRIVSFVLKHEPAGMEITVQAGSS